MIKDKTKGPRLVILASGSFDPITNYHVRIIELVKHYFKLKGVQDALVILSLTPKTRNTNQDCTDTADRSRMCELATANLPNLIIDDWESGQRCYTTLPRVLHHLTEKYCNTGDTVAVLVTEEHLEQMIQLPQEQVDDIVMDKNVVCVTPNPQSIVGMIQFCPKFNTHEDNIHIIIDFANTRKPRISEAVCNGQSIEWLVSASVLKYIRENQLYETDEDREISPYNLSVQVSPKTRVLLPRIQNTANGQKSSGKTKPLSPNMSGFLRVQRVSRKLPSIEHAYSELLQRRKDYWPGPWK